jgi:hypothetical protein
MWSDGEHLLHVKGLMTLDHFFDAWDKVPPGVAVAAHFRIRSHGASNAAMTHPFILKGGTIGVMHNGMIADTGSTHGSELSDTAMFVKDELDKLPHEWECNETIRRFLAYRIGAGSKLVFMRNDGVAWFTNESAGVWHEGVWYSNTSFRVTRVRRIKAWNGYGSSYYDDDDRDMPKHTASKFVAFGVKDDEEKYGSVVTGSTKGIFWNMPAGRWCRAVQSGKGCMLYDWDSTLQRFVVSGYAEWSSVNKMKPASGEENISSSVARDHFHIPEWWAEEVDKDDPVTTAGHLPYSSSNPGLHV